MMGLVIYEVMSGRIGRKFVKKNLKASVPIQFVTEDNPGRRRAEGPAENRPDREVGISE
jgi:hypothetical protein